MDRGGRWLIAVAIGSGLLIALLVYNWLDALEARSSVASGSAEHSAEETISVLVASEDLVRGARLSPENVGWRQWPRDYVREEYLVQGQTSDKAIYAAIAKGAIFNGTPILKHSVVFSDGTNSLSALLEPHMRAVSITVNAETSVSGFVTPGDRVDVLLTRGGSGATSGLLSGITDAISAPSSDASMIAAETILSDVQVLAVDQNTDDSRTTPELADTVTLELTPREAEVVRVAQQLGGLSLTLRSPSAPLAAFEHEQITYAQDVLTFESSDQLSARSEVTLPTTGLGTITGADDPAPKVQVLRGGSSATGGQPVFLGRQP